MARKLKSDKVLAVHDPIEADYHLLVNGTMHMTPSHPVRTKGEWVEIGKMNVGDTLTAADGEAVPITSIERIDGKVNVYNFTVNPYGTYVAAGIIVHNKRVPVEEQPPEGSDGP